jgi:hypothetical protein
MDVAGPRASSRGIRRAGAFSFLGVLSQPSMATREAALFLRYGVCALPQRDPRCRSYFCFGLREDGDGVTKRVCHRPRELGAGPTRVHPFVVLGFLFRHSISFLPSIFPLPPPSLYTHPTHAGQKPSPPTRDRNPPPHRPPRAHLPPARDVVLQVCEGVREAAEASTSRGEGVSCGG